MSNNTSTAAATTKQQLTPWFLLDEILACLMLVAGVFGVMGNITSFRLANGILIIPIIMNSYL